MTKECDRFNDAQWSVYNDRLRKIVADYVVEGITRYENATRKQLERQFLRRIASDRGAEVIFNDEPRAG